MLLEKPELVIAFPGGKGTADMVRKAMAAGVPVSNMRGTLEQLPTAIRSMKEPQ